MGDFARQAAIVAAAFTVAVVSGGLGTPGFIAALELSAAATTAATVAFYTASTLTLGAVSEALVPKPTIQQMENRVTVRSSMASRKFGYGRFASGGVLAYGVSHGTDNKYLALVHLHAIGECEGLVELHLGDEVVTFDGAGEAIGKYAGYIRCFFHSGTETQAADSYLVGKGGWTADHKCLGICYTVTEFTYSRKMFPRGLPNTFWVIDGRKIYDPRLDDTVAGGSGAHRADDPTTWAFSANVPLCWRDYRTDPVYGCKFPATRINEAKLIANANIADETITNKDASTMARYWLGGVVDTGARKGDNVAQILAAAGGFEVKPGGSFYPQVAAWQTPTVTLDEHDLRGDIQFIGKASRRERKNAVRGQYLQTTDWVVTDYPSRRNASWESDDGDQTRWLDLPLAMVTDHRLAQRLAKIEIERLRREETLVWPSKLKAFELQAGSTVMINHARFGFAAKTFRVLELTLDGQKGGVDLFLKAEDASVYPWVAASDEADPLSGGTLSLLKGDEAIDPTGLILTATSTSGTAGEVVPAISVTWDASTNPFLDRMLIEYQIDGASDWQRLEGADAATGSALITGLMSGTLYNVRLSYVTTLGIPSDTPATGSVTTGAVSSAGDASTIDGMEASLVRKGLPTAVRNGFEDFEFADWTENAADGNTLDQDGDAYVGASAGLFTHTAGGDPVSSGDTGGAFLRIPKEIALGYGGRQIRVTVYAKQPASSAAAEFAVAYSTADTGNSGWIRFTPTTSWAPYSFVVSVPAPGAGNDGFVGIWADTSNSGLGVLIDSVYVTPLTVEDELDALGLVNAPADAGATANTGALADQDEADFATQVTGAEKPEANATVGAKAGVNLRDSLDALLADTDVKNVEITINGAGEIVGIGTAGKKVDNADLGLSPTGQLTYGGGAINLGAVTILGLGFSGDLNATNGADDSNLSGLIGLNADVLARKNTITNAHTAQHIIAENTEKNQATDSTIWVTACWFNPDMAGDYRFSIEIRNEAEPTHFQAPAVRIRQGTTVLDSMTVDWAGSSSNWLWSHAQAGGTFLECSGINPADGPIEFQHMAGYKNTGDRWTKLRGIRIYSDNPRKPYFTQGPANYPEITQ